MAFHAALAVRQIEVGFASMLCLLFGLTACLYGVALFSIATYPRWMSGLAVIGGTLTMVAGVVIAYTGFSDITMAVNMPANFLLLVWMCGIGVVMWKREPSEQHGPVRPLPVETNDVGRQAVGFPPAPTVCQSYHPLGQLLGAA